MNGKYWKFRVRENNAECESQKSQKSKKKKNLRGKRSHSHDFQRTQTNLTLKQRKNPAS